MLKGIFMDVGDTIIVEEEGKSLGDMAGELVTGAREFLADMSKDYTLTVVSNTVNSYAADMDRLFKKLGLRSYFSHIITSLDVGIAKPEAGIYEEALRVSGLSVNEVVMIGDRVDTDILGANRMGICSVLLRWRARHPLDILSDAHKPTHHVSTFDEVRTILKSL